jgi:hypothetical protein
MPRLSASGRDIQLMEEAFDLLSYAYKESNHHNSVVVPNKWRCFIAFMMGVPSSKVAHYAGVTQRSIYHWRDDYINLITRHLNGFI